MNERAPVSMASPPVFDITPPPPVTTVLDRRTHSPKAPKSKLKNLFAWKRLSSNEQNSPHASPVESNIEPSLATTDARPVTPVEQIPARSRRAHRDSKLRQQSRSQSRPPISTDSQSFAYVCSHANLRSVLQVPAKGLLDRLSFGAVNRSSLTVADASPSTSYLISLHGSDPIRGSHSDVPAHNAPQLTERILVLYAGGTILQYKADGSPDRLPEKMLQLTYESTAFASDAIAGKHWVINVSASGSTTEDGKLSSPISPWSILSFRSAESKRPTENLLLVFGSPELMAVWMSALRKEIEALGGDHYRSKTPDMRAAPISPLGSCPSDQKGDLLRLSRSSSSLRMSSLASQLEKDLPRLPIPPTYTRTNSARSMTASSIATTTSLDRLRDSDAGSTTTATTNSLDGSVTLDSPVKASFADITTFMPSVETRASILSDHKTRTSTATMMYANSHDRKPSLSQKRGHSRGGSSVNAISLESSPDQRQDANPSIRPDFSRLTLRSNAARPVAILPPLPSPDAARRPSLAERALSADCVSIAPTAMPLRPKTSHERHVSKQSLDQSKHSYSLFPKPRVQEARNDPAIIAQLDFPSQPLLESTVSRNEHSLMTASGEASIVNQPSGKIVGKKPSPLILLAPVQLEQPQRSPAVTEDMLASNFGTALFGPQHSPLSPKKSQVPSFDDLKFDFSFLTKDFGDRSSSPTSDCVSNVRKQRSTPNLRNSRMPSAPVGPPPKRPLPAIPPPTESTNENQEQTKPSCAGVLARRSQSQHSRRTSSRSAVAQSQLRPPSIVIKVRSPSKSTITPPGSKRNSITTRSDSLSPPNTQCHASLGMISTCTPTQIQGRTVKPGESVSQIQERGRSVYR